MVQPVEEARKEETWGALSAENIAWLCVCLLKPLSMSNMLAGVHETCAPNSIGMVIYWMIDISPAHPAARPQEQDSPLPTGIFQKYSRVKGHLGFHAMWLQELAFESLDSGQTPQLVTCINWWVYGIAKFKGILVSLFVVAAITFNFRYYSIVCVSFGKLLEGWMTWHRCLFLFIYPINPEPSWHPRPQGELEVCHVERAVKVVLGPPNSPISLAYRNSCYFLKIGETPRSSEKLGWMWQCYIKSCY